MMLMDPEVFVMNILKGIKKISALGLGVALVSTSIMGAVGNTLENYPRPFVSDGEFNGLIILGEDAQTIDVISAIDIAASLQYETREPATVVSNGDGATVSVSGDAIRIDLDHNRLEFGEMLGDVMSTLTEEDIEALRSGTFHNRDYTQTITLADGAVRYSLGDDFYYEDEPGWYLEFQEGDMAYRYSLEFPSGVRSNINNNELRDFVDKNIEILGREYTVGSATLDNDDMLTLELLGGEVSDQMNEGQVATYTLDNTDYEVEVVFAYEGRTRLRINGESTRTLDVGDTYKLEDGVEIGIRDIITLSGDRPGIVEFYLGADKMILRQTDDSEGASIRMGDDSYGSTRVFIDGEVTNSRYELRSIDIEVFADDTYYLKEGDSLATFLTGERDDIMFGDFNIHFLGPTSPTVKEVEIRETRDDEYSLRFETRAGSYNIPIWYFDELRLGGDRNDMTFWVVPGYDLDETEHEVWISKDDKFVLNTGTARAEDTTTRVFRFDRARSDSDRYIISLRDMSTGGGTREVVVRYDSDDNIYKGTLRIDGQEHKIYYDGSSAGNSELLGLERVYHPGTLTLASGTYFEFRDIGEYNIDNEWEWDLSGGYELVHVVPENRFTGAGAGDQEWVFDMDDGVSIQQSSSPAGNRVTINDRYDVWYSTYGMRVREDTDASRQRIDIRIPDRQVLPQVYATSGPVEVSESEHTVPGDYFKISLISPGMAVLDTDVRDDWRDHNVIVVGGPCVNLIAAELLDNPEVCTDPFTQGVGRIKLFEHNDRVAMLVAGYDGEDTAKASRVVHSFRDYENFIGTELEVSGTSMTSLTVTSVE